MFRLIVGIVIIIGGLVVLAASAARQDNLGIGLGLGFFVVGGIIAGTGARR